MIDCETDRETHIGLERERERAREGKKREGKKRDGVERKQKAVIQK